MFMIGWTVNVSCIVKVPVFTKYLICGAFKVKLKHGSSKHTLKSFGLPASISYWIKKTKKQISSIGSFSVVHKQNITAILDTEKSSWIKASWSKVLLWK